MSPAERAEINRLAALAVEAKRAAKRERKAVERDRRLLDARWREKRERSREAVRMAMNIHAWDCHTAYMHGDPATREQAYEVACMAVPPEVEAHYAAYPEDRPPTWEDRKKQDETRRALWAAAGILITQVQP